MSTKPVLFPAPLLALVGCVVVMRETIGTDNPEFVCKVEFGEGNRDLARNTAIVMAMVTAYNRWIEAAEAAARGRNDQVPSAIPELRAPT